MSGSPFFQDLLDIFWDGERMTYNEGFALVMAQGLAMLGGIAWFVALVIHFVIWFIMYRRRNKKAVKTDVEQPPGEPQMQGQQGQHEEQQNHYQQVPPRDAPNKKKAKPQNIDSTVNVTKLYMTLEAISGFFWWAGAAFFAMMFPLLSGFHLLSIPGSIILMVIFFMLCVLYQLIRTSIYMNEKRFWHRLKKAVDKTKWFLLGGGCVLIFLSIFLPILFENSCLCFYNTVYGVPLFSSVSYSTKMTREYNLPEIVCERDKICHYYATLPARTSEDVFINVQTGLGVEWVKITIDDQVQTRQQVCEEYDFPEYVEDKGQRYMFTCLIQGLKPTTVYNLVITTDTNVTMSTSYRTFAKHNVTSINPMRILFGGDYGNMDDGRKLLSAISIYDPDLIIIGGDVAYDNGNNDCYYSWDLMLWQFEEEFEQIGRIVPFVFSVGNHDVGYNALAELNITVRTRNGPLFFTYFPQLYANEGNFSGVPGVEHRRTFFHHFIGDMLLVGLDSGYLYKTEGIQLRWFEALLNEWADDYYVFVHYHNPIYPTCWTNSSLLTTQKVQNHTFEHWLPLFDKYGVVGAFENHVHQFKRTFPLKNNTVQQDPNIGTVYFGDGAMGVQTVACTEETMTNETSFKDKFAAYQVVNSSHYWIMYVHPNGVLEYFAYTPHQTIVNGSYWRQDLANRPKYTVKDDL